MGGVFIIKAEGINLHGIDPWACVLNISIAGAVGERGVKLPSLGDSLEIFGDFAGLASWDRSPYKPPHNLLNAP